MSTEATFQSLTFAAMPGRSDKQRSEIPRLGGLLVVSVAMHVLAIAGVTSGRRADSTRPRPPTLVTMEVAPPAASAPEAASPSPAPSAPKAARVVRKVATARPVRVSAAPRVTPRAPEAETPTDFSGVTLTNDGPGAGWASATGNGAAMQGPIGTPGRKVTGRSLDGAPAGTGPAREGPPVLGLADLSRPPRAPALNDILERNYPNDARKRGIQGNAMLRVRIMPDGHVRDLIVLAESGAGFGDACRRTLRGSIWSPPLDREARPVSTYVSYTCKFEVH
jgi:TonB family protein